MQPSIKGLLLGKGSGVAGQGFRYIIAGGTAFALDFFLLYICTHFIGINYVISAAVGFMAGLLVTYVLSTRWVFSRRKMANRWAEFLLFSLIGLIGIGLTMLLVWLFTEHAGLHYLLSKIITTFIVTGWNFAAKKIILF
ncbi:MAG: GtrA family protein [Alistipes sp.]|nr:GtrA family protein [Alistipes sp.]